MNAFPVSALAVVSIWYDNGLISLKKVKDTNCRNVHIHYHSTCFFSSEFRTSFKSLEG